MPLRRVRVSVRGMMTLVALVAILTAGFIFAMRMSRRAEAYRVLAIQHEMEARAIATSVEGNSGQDLLRPEELARLEPVMFAYHDALRRKFETAARCPWVSVPRDPPDPLMTAVAGRWSYHLSIRYGRHRP